MPDYEYRRSGDGEQRDYEGQGDNERGYQNTTSGGGDSGSQGSSSNQGSSGSQGNGASQNSSSQGQSQNQRPQRNQESYEGQESKESQMTHSTPIVFASAPACGYPGFPPYGGGYGYQGFNGGAPAGSAPQTTVVTGTGNDGHHSDHDNHDALLGITVDNIRESSSVGRTAQLSQQIEGLGDRADFRASFDRDMHTFQEFNSLQKGQWDIESRLGNAIKDSTAMVLDKMNEQRIRELEARLANTQEARRDDRTERLLEEIVKKMSTSAK